MRGAGSLKKRTDIPAAPMEIRRIEWYPKALPRKEVFATSRHSSDVANVVFVRLDVEGAEAWGAASPSGVTGETTETVLEALPKLAATLKGFSFARGREVSDRMEKALPGNNAAKAAVDIAVFDAIGKSRNLPLYRHLGAARESAITDRTVGLMDVDDAVGRAERFVAEGFRAVKVKLGGKVAEDVERMTRIRKALGNHILLRADANQAFTYRSALAFAKQAYGLVVEFFEQPLPADDLAGMQSLTESSPIPVMADESVVTPQDAAKVGWGKCARLVNLKLMKTGGIARAIETNAICESAGMPTMVGCNAESTLSIAAGLHVALSQKNVRFVDLDSHFSLAEDPASGVIFEDGYLKATERPGLGVAVDL